MMQNRNIEIHGRKLIVFDDFMDKEEVESFYKFLINQAYRHSEFDGPATRHIKQWALQLPIEEILQMDLIHRIDGTVQEQFKIGHKIKPSRFYCNAVTYGDMTFPHRDCPVGHGMVTALVFANREWKTSWGGETHFYNNDEDPIACVLPKPGRLALFHGDILHRTGVPSRECYETRLSLAFKFDY